VTIINSTVSHNSPGGIVNFTFGHTTVEIQNVILVKNILGRDCVGPITSLGNNIIGDTTNCEVTLQSNDLPADLALGGVIDDGAPGHGRFPLLPGSPAIDAGNDSACPASDQLSTPRRGACDIGAVEFYPIINDLVAVANMTTDFDPTPVPDGPAGTFHITADFTNTSGQAIVNPFAEVVELSGGNLLLNADGGAGGVGARVSVGNSGPLSLPGTTETFEFLIGLQSRDPFTFFVNVLGDTQPTNSFE
jgi:hypothetical protein